MAITKVNSAAKSQVKYFTGGLPRDFELVCESNRARVFGSLTTDRKSYKVLIGNETAQAAIVAKDLMQVLDAKALRETAEHFMELAGLLDGSLSVAA